MENQEPQKKPKYNRMTFELVVMALVFFGIIIGVQALQGEASRPQYNPFAMLYGAVRTLLAMRGH